MTFPLTTLPVASVAAPDLCFAATPAGDADASPEGTFAAIVAMLIKQAPVGPEQGSAAVEDLLAAPESEWVELDLDLLCGGSTAAGRPRSSDPEDPEEHAIDIPALLVVPPELAGAQPIVSLEPPSPDASTGTDAACDGIGVSLNPSGGIGVSLDTSGGTISPNPSRGIRAPLNPSGADGAPLPSPVPAAAPAPVRGRPGAARAVADAIASPASPAMELSESAGPAPQSGEASNRMVEALAGKTPGPAAHKETMSGVSPASSAQVAANEEAVLAHATEPARTQAPPESRPASEAAPILAAVMGKGVVEGRRESSQVAAPERTTPAPAVEVSAPPPASSASFDTGTDKESGSRRFPAIVPAAAGRRLATAVAASAVVAPPAAVVPEHTVQQLSWSRDIAPSAPDSVVRVVQQVVHSVRLQWTHGEGQARILLTPPELGQLDVSLRVANGVVRATIQASTPAASAWIDAHRDEMKAALAEAGLHLDELVIDADSEPQHHQAREEGDGGRSPKRRRESLEGRTFDLRV